MDKKLKPSEKVYPWYGESQKNLNAKRSGIHLLKVVNERAHTRIKQIRNSPEYQAAYAQNAQSALQEPVLKGSQPEPLLVSDVKENEDDPQIVGVVPVSETVERIRNAPIEKKVGRFTVLNAPEGGRRTRKHRRKNVSRLNRNVRNTSRNGAHHGRSRRRHNIK